MARRRAVAPHADALQRAPVSVRARRFRARSVLDKPFDEVSKAIGLKFNFTPRGMPRTYQDLARAAGIHDVVTRAISGHVTPAMRLHYSTARGGEVKQAPAAVAKIATAGANVIPIDRARRCKRA